MANVTLQERLKERADKWYLYNENHFLIKALYKLGLIQPVHRIPQREAILDEDSSQFVNSVRLLHRMFEYGPNSSVSIDQYIGAFETAQKLLPKLGYDANLHQSQRIARTLVERIIDIANVLFMSGSHDRAIREIDFVDEIYFANEIDKRYKLGIDPCKRVVEQLMTDFDYEVKHASYEHAIKKANLATELCKRFNVDIDIKNQTYPLVIDALINHAYFWILEGSYDRAIESASRAREINLKYEIGKDQKLNALYRRLGTMQDNKVTRSVVLN